MKKLGLAVAVATALGATSAVVNAYTIAQYANGLLVPYASFQSEAEGAAVGLMSNCAGKVYWTFFDVNTKHVTDGSFNMTKNDMYSFIWSKEAGFGLEGMPGYLLFLMDTGDEESPPDGAVDKGDDHCLAGSAFYVDLNADDVQFVPTAPVAYHDLNHGQGASNLTTMDNDDLTALVSGAQWDEAIDMRYFIDGSAGGDDTSIVVWTVCKPPTTNTVDMFDDEQNRKSVNFNLPNDELNVVDPETILGRPSDFLDGFVRWYVSAAPAPATGGKAYCDHDGDGEWDWDDDSQAALSYSIVDSPSFGAVQTMYNPHTWTHFDVD